MRAARREQKEGTEKVAGARSEPMESREDIRKHLDAQAITANTPLSSRAFAEHMDAVDPIRDGRTQFFVPSMKDLGVTEKADGDGNRECVYLCGNSLGLQPRAARALVNEELDKWSKKGVNG